MCTSLDVEVMSTYYTVTSNAILYSPKRHFLIFYFTFFNFYSFSVGFMTSVQ